MRVVIIGGKGLIGGALSKELIAHGHQVTILSRGEGKDRADSVVQQRWDGKDSAQLAVFLEGQDAVVNLAGESIGKSRWTSERKQLIRNSRIQVGKSLVDAITSLPVKPQVLIQASAIGYYGTGSGSCDENTPQGNDWLANVCADWENSLSGVRDTGIRLVTIRSGVVLAREGGVLAQLELPVRLFVGGPIGSGKQWISWITLTDEVRAIRFLIERNDCKGTFNLTAPDPVSNRKMGKTLAKVLHRPFWFPLPAFALRLLLGEMSTLVLDGQEVLPVGLLKAGFKFEFSNLEPALRDLYPKAP
jgi:uncharacterized protein (TIGR01777 family)